MVDKLGSRFNAKLEGIDVDRRKLWHTETRKQRIIKGQNGQIVRNRQADLFAKLYQYKCKDIIADNNRCRAVFLF